MPTNDTKTFDLDALLGNATPALEPVTLYANNALRAQIVRLERKRRDAAEAGKQGGGSWADPTGGAGDVTAIDKELGKLRAELAKSAIEFVVQALDPDELDRIEREHKIPAGADDDVRMRVNRERFVAQIAAQIVEPRKFTVEEVVKLRRAVGEGEFDKLAKAALDARQGTSVNAPFSRDTFGTDLT